MYSPYEETASAFVVSVYLMENIAKSHYIEFKLWPLNLEFNHLLSNLKNRILSRN